MRGKSRILLEIRKLSARNPILGPFHERSDEIFRIYVIDATLTIANDDSPEDVEEATTTSKPTNPNCTRDGQADPTCRLSNIIFVNCETQYPPGWFVRPSRFHLYLRVGNRSPVLDEGSVGAYSPRLTLYLSRSKILSYSVADEII